MSVVTLLCDSDRLRGTGISGYRLTAILYVTSLVIHCFNCSGASEF